MRRREIDTPDIHVLAAANVGDPPVPGGDRRRGPLLSKWKLSQSPVETQLPQLAAIGRIVGQNEMATIGAPAESLRLTRQGGETPKRPMRQSGEVHRIDSRARHADQSELSAIRREGRLPGLHTVWR